MDEPYEESDDECEIESIRQINAILKSGNKSADESVSQYSVSTASSVPTQAAGPSTSKIEVALALNKLTDEKLTRLERVLVTHLNECREKLRNVQSEFLPHRTRTTGCYLRKDEKYFYIRCGKPYFKDKHMFPAPENSDTIAMRELGMFDYTSISSVAGWTVKDKGKFLDLILKLTREIKSKEYIAVIHQYDRIKKTRPLTNDEEKLVTVASRQLAILDKRVLKDLALPINFEYDWEYVSCKLDCRHSPEEYRALWKLFLHPSINKRSWSKAESMRLVKIARKYRSQDWENIATELNTGRSGYQCFVYYRTNMTPSAAAGKWTPDEEEYLFRLIDFFKYENYIPWNKISNKMPNRTKMQIYSKFVKLTTNKGRFLPEEDTVLLTCIEKYGANFKQIQKYLPGRCMSQIRSRYMLLQGKKTSTVWKVEEDRLLVQLMANQEHASSYNYISLLEHFPGKTRHNIRMRFQILQKWMLSHPNADISMAPRRGARRLNKGEATATISEAVAKLKERVENNVQNYESGKLSLNSPEKDIESAIAVLLLNQEMATDAAENMTDSEAISESSARQANLYSLLVLLKSTFSKDAFASSSHAHTSEWLLKLPTVCAPKRITSYSRKQSVSQPNMADVVDVWGPKTLTATQYCLPPNLNTITGCKLLMKYSSNAPHPEESDTEVFNLVVNCRRNVIFKEQWQLFLRRFQFLFLWPVLLSNGTPNTQS